jgi:hypothetical protein
MLAIVSTRQLGWFIPAPTMQTWKSTFGLVMLFNCGRYRNDSTTEEKVETSEHDIHQKTLITSCSIAENSATARSQLMGRPFGLIGK